MTLLRGRGALSLPRFPESSTGTQARTLRTSTTSVFMVLSVLGTVTYRYNFADANPTGESECCRGFTIVRCANNIHLHAHVLHVHIRIHIHPLLFQGRRPRRRNALHLQVNRVVGCRWWEHSHACVDVGTCLQGGPIPKSRVATTLCNSQVKVCFGAESTNNSDVGLIGRVSKQTLK